MNSPPIQSLRAFVRIAETGQFRRAADQLALTESAVSHQIARLEKQLGVRLFERGAGGATLTEVGRLLFARVRPALSEIAASVAEVSAARRETVTITMAQSVASMWFAERLPAFYARHPDVKIDVLTSTDVFDLRRDQIDFAIRMGSGRWKGCIAERLMREWIAPLGAPSVSARMNIVGWKKLVRESIVIANSLHPDEWNLWCTHFGMDKPPTAQVRRLASFDLVAKAAAAGLGFAMGRSPLHDGLIESGELVLLVPEMKLKSAWYFLVRSSQLPLRGSVLKVYRWLRAQGL